MTSIIVWTIIGFAAVIGYGVYTTLSEASERRDYRNYGQRRTTSYKTYR